MPDATVIAHISDLHMTPLAGFTPRHWNVKRTLGLLNWHRGRKAVHRREIVDALVDDMRAFAPDHIAVTGDLCNIGLPAEYEAALVWLEALGDPRMVSVVPGNHDIYTRLRSHGGVETWRPYMRADEFGETLAAPPGRRGFPYVRRVGNIALVGVNSAIETRPFVSAGRVGEEQLARLATLLENLGSSGLARVVMIHHPPLPGQASANRGMADAHAVEAVLARHGAELVVHGHMHRDSLVWCEGGHVRVPILGIASGSAAHRHKGEPLGRYNLIRVRKDGGAWCIEVIGRGLTAGGTGVVELDRMHLTPC